MKTLKTSMYVFLALLAMTFVSCGEQAGTTEEGEKDATTATTDDTDKEASDNNEASATGSTTGLSEASRAIMAEQMKSECACISENADEVKKMADALQPLLEKLESGAELEMKEAMGMMMGAMTAAPTYAQCSRGKQTGSPEDMVKVKAELDELFADLSEEEKQMKQAELGLEIMKNECPDGAEAFSKIMKVGVAMQKLQKGGQ